MDQPIDFQLYKQAFCVMVLHLLTSIIFTVSDQHLDQPIYLRLHEQGFQTSFSRVTQSEKRGKWITRHPHRSYAKEQHALMTGPGHVHMNSISLVLEIVVGEIFNGKPPTLH